MILNGIQITADPSLTSEEISMLVEEEVKLWQNKNKAIASMEISLEGDNIVVQASEKSPVRRVRRITGYLSNIDNFNDAKKQECHDRVIHM